MTERPYRRAGAAARMAAIAPFHVVEVMQRARALEAQGRTIVHLEVGEPDFPTPEPVIDAASAFLARGQVRYTEALGLPRLREAIAGFYERRYGLRVPPERIVVTAGASGALLLALAALVDPGDEVLLADPGYPCNRHLVRCFEGAPRSIPVDAASGYQPTAAQIERMWRPATRALLVASPANPTGTLIGQRDLADIAQAVRQRGGVLLVDEIYHGLTYGCDAPTALALGEDVIVINSFSKYFGMTGWRLGWLVVPAPLVRQIEKLAQNLFISPSAPAQYGALAAFAAETIDILEQRRSEFQSRRDLLLAALPALGFQIGTEPRGAFYVYADCSPLARDSAVLANRLLEEAGVAVTPGLDFGEHRAHRHLRLAYTVPIAQLEEAVARIAGWLNRQQSRPV